MKRWQIRVSFWAPYERSYVIDVIASSQVVAAARAIREAQRMMVEKVGRKKFTQIALVFFPANAMSRKVKNK